MVARDVIIWLLLLVSCSSAGPRYKRTGLKSLFFPSTVTTPSPYPIWKVHKYTGIQLQPLVSPHTHHRRPQGGGEAPSVVDLPDYSDVGADEGEESPSALGSLGSILTLIPGGLTGLIGLSRGSTREERNEKAEDRIGLALKKDLLTAALQKKKNLFSAISRDVLQLALKKKHGGKGWALDSVFGAPHGGSGVYYQVPLHYPKKPGLLSHLPLVGHLFGGGEDLHLPEVHLPSIPNLISVRDPPQLPIINLPGKYHSPYQSGVYVKVDFPRHKKPLAPTLSEYPIPGTSYAIPEKPVPVPESPLFEHRPPTYPSEEFFVDKTTTRPSFIQSITTSKPEIYPQVYPYPPELSQFPVAAQFPTAEPIFPISVQTFPYPQSSYPYPIGEYYDARESEFQPLRVSPVYRHSDEKETEPVVENELEDRRDDEYEEAATEENVDKGETVKATTGVESR